MKVVQDTMSIRLSKAFTIYKLSYRPKNIQAFWYTEYDAWLSCNKTWKEIQLQKTKHRRIFFWYINKMTRIKISKEQTISTSMQKPGKFLHMQGTAFISDEKIQASSILDLSYWRLGSHYILSPIYISKKKINISKS